MSLAGLITEIKRFATHDGPGIRTTVFLKGCPLRCRWCSNPAGLEPRIELAFVGGRCQRSLGCATMCTEGALDLERPGRVDRSRCTLCLDCVRGCPHGAFEAVGRELTLDAIVAEVDKDRPFYGSDGGVTLCGGEPLMQADLCIALLRECRARGMTTVLDTSGYAPPEVVTEAMRYTDLVLLDVKHTTPWRTARARGSTSTSSGQAPSSCAGSALCVCRCRSCQGSTTVARTSRPRRASPGRSAYRPSTSSPCTTSGCRAIATLAWRRRSIQVAPLTPRR